MDAKLAIQNWTRFKTPIMEAAVLCKTIEGSAGELLRKTVDTVDEMALGFHQNWPKTWAKRNEKVLRAQQTNALHALCEIQQAMQRLVVIFEHRRKEYSQKGHDPNAYAKKKILVASSVASTSRDQSQTDHAAPQLDRALPQSGYPVGGYLDDGMEIKEEIKEEPLDDPIADSYCPDTGASRPLYAADVGDLYARTISEVADAPNRNEARLRALLDDEDAASQVTPIDTMASGSPQCKRCYLCDKRIFKYYEIPGEAGLRLALLNRIVKFDRDERMKLNLLKDETIPAFICPSHISRSALRENRLDRGIVKEEEYRLRAQVTKGSTKAGAPRKIAPRCDMCGSPGHNFIITPKEPAAAQRFFHSLTNITDNQRQKLQYYLKHSRQWHICRRHLTNDTAAVNRTRIMPPFKQAISNELKDISKRCDMLMQTVQQHTNKIPKEEEAEIKIEEDDL